LSVYSKPDSVNQMLRNVYSVNTSCICIRTATPLVVLIAGHYFFCLECCY